jgi:hypothetical protein
MAVRERDVRISQLNTGSDCSESQKVDLKWYLNALMRAHVISFLKPRYEHITHAMSEAVLLAHEEAQQPFSKHNTPPTI